MSERNEQQKQGTNPELSIVIPAWNEGSRIDESFRQINAYVTSKNMNVEVLVIDDGSSDNTREVVTAAGTKYPYIKLVTYGEDRTENHGKGYAVKFGMLKAKGDVVLFADADGSTPYEEYEKMKPLFAEGADVVIGSRYIKGSHIRVPQPLLRRILSRSANKLIQVMILWGIKDTQCGFKAFTQKACQDIFSQVTIERWGFDMEVLVIARRHKYKIAEAAVRWENSADTRMKLASDTRQTLHDLMYLKMNLLKGKYDPRVALKE